MFPYCLQLHGELDVSLSEVPVRSSKEAEGHGQGNEEGKEDDVCANRANEEDKGYDGHPREVKCCGDDVSLLPSLLMAIMNVPRLAANIGVCVPNAWLSPVLE